MTNSQQPRKHLLWVNHFAVTPDMGGGTRHLEMSRELVRRGWRVTLAASDFHLHHRRYMRREDASQRHPVCEQVDGVEVEWLWAAPYAANDRKRVQNWLSFSRSLLGDKFVARSSSVVIGSTPHLFAALAAHRVARRAGVPFVLEVRDLWPESLDVGGRHRGPGYWALWAIARFLYRTADHVIALAQGVADYLVSLGVGQSRITVIPNGVDLDLFDHTPREPRQSLGLVYAGAHGPANGLEAVLEAAQLLHGDSRVTFSLVGDGPSKAVLQERASAMKLTNVYFMAAVPKLTVPSMLGSYDSGLMVLKDVPLFSFGVSPNKLLDYWGASLPVVCNVPGEVGSCVSESGGGIQAADATGSALARAVSRLLALSLHERRAMGERGHDWVARERNRGLLVDRLQNVLDRLLTERS